MLGAGDGSLSSHVDYETGDHAETDSPTNYGCSVCNSPNSVTITDVNGDGNPDVIEVDSDSAQVSVLLGMGDGTLAPRVSYPTGGTSLSVAAADVNGDHVLDLVVTNGDTDTVGVLIGKGDGTFAADTVVRMDYPVEDETTAGALADLNGDGKLDLIVVSYTGASSPGKISVQLGTGDGGFTAVGSYPCGLGSNQIAVGDVNGDGKLDVLVANLGANTVSVLLGTGTGELVPKGDYPTGLGPSALALGDLDADGVPDLVTANGSNTVSVLLGKGDGQFATNVDYPGQYYPRAVAVADVNGDGKLDVVTVNISSVSVLAGKGNGQLAASVDDLVDNAIGGAFGDLNSDGHLDVVTTNYDTGVVSVLTGKGDGTFAPNVNYSVGYEPRSVVLADVNGDGRPDILVLDARSASISVLLGNKDGSFASKLDYTTGITSVVSWLAAGDLNRDGKIDLVVGAYSPSTVSVLLNMSR
jgi:hypothetical protein